MCAARRVGEHPGEFGPESYRSWRRTDIGTITEELERRLIVRLAGPVRDRAALDVGSGDGALTLVLSQAGASSVVGCDVDPRMLARAAAAKHAARISYVMGRAEKLPFRDGSFEIVTVITVLAFVPEGEQALREIARVLRPGGRLVIGELGKWSQWAASRRIRSWLRGGMWRGATFRSAGEWRRLVETTGLHVDQVIGAAYYPRWTWLARVMAPLDPLLGHLTTIGAAFLAVQATKP